jgi:hypothetical protein
MSSIRYDISEKEIEKIRKEMLEKQMTYQISPQTKTYQIQQNTKNKY